MTDTLAKGKQRIPYKLNEVLPQVQQQGRDIDNGLDAFIDVLKEACRDRHITDDELAELAERLMRLVRASKEHLLTVGLLTESGPEAALRDLEQRAAARTKARGAAKP